jgi:hypothetical protein
MDPFVVLSAAAAVTKTPEARHGRVPCCAARSHSDGEAGCLDPNTYPAGGFLPKFKQMMAEAGRDPSIF